MTPPKPPHRRGELALPGDEDSFWQVDHGEGDPNQVTLRPPASYRQALGGEPIRVGLVEFQIMMFLASRPYHAFTRREIAAAVGSPGGLISEQAVDAYVASLRDQLGVFHDFVQSVPGVGYRYKA